MVKPKKYLGQHFLKDDEVSKQIANAISAKQIVEIGPGTGALTKHLTEKETESLDCFEVDAESVAYLQNNLPQIADHLYQADFLQANFSKPPFGEDWKGAIVGNFPYNVSSQILFKVYEERNKVTEVVGMFQKEVAKRVAAKPGNKTYGILSVLLQAYYDIEYLFSVPPEAFYPPPKVYSGVIKMKRNNVNQLNCDEKKFKQTVKAAFNQRRKTLRNALKSIADISSLNSLLLNERAEQLTVDQFVETNKQVGKHLIQINHIPLRVFY